MDRYNLIVLGAGSGGLTVAAGGAAVGARVALLEKHRMGGDCLNYGCVPSKALLRAARAAHAVGTAAQYGVRTAGPLPPQDLRAIMDYVRSAQARIAPHDSVERFRDLGVDVRLSAGRLRTPHELTLGEGGETIWGRHIVLATGSRPRIPALPGLREAGFLTNETIFDTTRLPAALVVIGGGPIGAELGQAFARLGSRVTIVSTGPHILPREDEDVADVLARRLAAEGVTVLARARAVRVDQHAGMKRVIVQAPGGERTIDADEILVAAGRRPNVEDLGLEALGIAFDEHGVRTDAACRTTVPGVWAIGDVAGRHLFTHWANYQARIVIRNTLFPGTWSCDAGTVPWTTFTEPEVARVGLSEAEARQRGIAYDRFTASFDDNDRALCDGEPEGVVKVLTRKGGGTILGAAIVHAHAGELLAELVLAKKHGLGLGKLSTPIHVYPTLAEANRAVGDAYLRGRLRPGVRRALSAVFRWLRR
ncbi:MAG: FAD-dependent oxidoreductase [Candidatus Rokubacteria bacterium]|nr:FAD-dependent oxidoreductase [Candidatus Rokubacteria bacterium]